MALRTDLTPEEYLECESGNRNLSIAFLYRCTLSFGVDMGDLLEGKSPKLRSYALTRKGEGQRIEEAHHMVGYNLAAGFRNRIALPLYMELANRPGAEYEDMITVGDNINDTHMIAEFRSYAMENAVQAIKDIADYETHGITELIEKEMGM